MNQVLWQKAVKEHGHKCVGLAFGFRMGEEAKTIFGNQEQIKCKMPMKNCITDGIGTSLDASIESGTITIDPALDGFVFYVDGDDEGWKISQRKMELPEGADPVAAVLTYNREMLMTMEPCDIG